LRRIPREEGVSPPMASGIWTRLQGVLLLLHHNAFLICNQQMLAISEILDT
jgi:hypothetical protein